MAKGVHPNTLKTLEKHKYQKGKVPTGGRPKGSLSLKERMDKFMHLPTKVVMPDGSITEKSVLDSVVLGLLAKARKGDIPAVKEVLERYFGKEADRLELTGKNGEALQIEHGVKLDNAWDNIKDAFGVTVDNDTEE